MKAVIKEKRMKRTKGDILFAIINYVGFGPVSYTHLTLPTTSRV